MQHNFWTRRLAGTVMALSFMSLVSCSSGPEFAEVEGTITNNGQPLERIAVEFHPKGEGPRSTGTTDATGKYTLTAETGQAGAIVGPHVVVLRDVSIYPDRPLSDAELNQDFAKGKKIRISLEHGDRGRSKLERTVTSGSRNKLDIDVK